MSDPERLLDGPLPADIAGLLRSADNDIPPAPEANQRRICAALAGAGAGAATAVPPAPPAVSSTVRNVGWVAFAAAVLTVGALSVDATFATSAPSSGDASGAPASIARTAPEPAAPDLSAAPASPAPRDEAAAVPSMRVDDLPTAMPPAAPVRAPDLSRGQAANEPRREVTSVEDELKAIDAARAALATKHPADALSHVQRYRSTFPRARFVDEADALEVQALAALGRADEARAKASRFVEAYPNSPYTQRVRSAAGMRDRAGDQ